MVRYLLRGLVIATVGDFGASRGHKVLRAWIERRGGVWSREITSAITHLVCTKEAFKQQGTIGRITFSMLLPVNSEANRKRSPSCADAQEYSNCHV